MQIHLQSIFDDIIFHIRRIPHTNGARSLDKIKAFILLINSQQQQKISEVNVAFWNQIRAFLLALVIQVCIAGLIFIGGLLDPLIGLWVTGIYFFVVGFYLALPEFPWYAQCKHTFI